MILHSKILGAGRPFVILHGFLGMGDNWKTLGTQFSKSGFEVHLVDQRNHGRSFWDSSFNYDDLADDLKAYSAYHNLKDLVVLGHSMGGKTAMQFATQYPELVAKLIIADIAPRFYPVHHQTILEGLSALDFRTIQSRSAADDMLKTFVENAATRQFLLKNLYWVKPKTLGLRINLPVLKETVTEVGASLPSMALFQKDTLFLRGDRSEYIGVEDERAIMSHFPKAKIVTIPDAGHWLHAENPKAFFDAVMRFMTPPTR